MRFFTRGWTRSSGIAGRRAVVVAAATSLLAFGHVAMASAAGTAEVHGTFSGASFDGVTVVVGPLAGGTVSLATAAGTAAGSAVTGSDGTYSISGLEAGIYTATFAKTGNVVIKQSFELGAAESKSVSASTASNVLAPLTMGTLSGGVLDGPSGVPLAWVEIRNQDVGEPMVTVLTDSLGNYSIPLGATGQSAALSSYTVTFRKPGYTQVVVPDVGITAGSGTALNATLAADAMPPETTITQKPPAFTNDATPAFAFQAELYSTFGCAIDDGVPASCESPWVSDGLADGAHVFHVLATDSAGNVELTEETYDFVIDTLRPVTTITRGPSGPTTRHRVTFRFKSNEGGTFRCKLDRRPYSSCVSPRTLSNLKRGKHTFRVQARDLAGNRDSTPAIRTFRVL